MSSIKIEQSWKEILDKEFSKEYFPKIKNAIIADKQRGTTVYPSGNQIFEAFNLTPFNEVKVVILGQDPYHGPGEAMGLCFSVPEGVKIPPSLRNIFKEINQDVDVSIPDHGNLTSWAQQGVLLLNAVLTVRHKEPGSHRKIGWQKFTDAVIRALSDNREGLVFLLWGNFAKEKKSLIDELKHHVLTSPHPSPLAGGGFFGNHHFSRTNEILKRNGANPINWNISNE